MQKKNTKSDKIRLIAGLGNPGTEYARTRHNAGFMAADFIAGRVGIYGWQDWKGLGEYASWEQDGEKVYLLKPQTYMNLSGRAVQSLASFFKIPPQQVLVIFDDLSIPFGSVRLRRNGSGGSHNGMGSVINMLGTTDIPRLRIGIGMRPQYIPGKDFVLGNFQKDQLEQMPEILEKAWLNVRKCVEDGMEKAISQSVS